MIQLTLDLPSRRRRMSREAYIVGDANADYLGFIDRWRLSGERLLAICGAPSSGKSHLATILAHDLGARWLTPAEIAGDDDPMSPGDVKGGSPDARHDAMIIDDVQAATSADTLFDLVEAARQGAFRLVLAGRGKPGDWSGGLPDLATRLEAAPRLEAGPPDEEVLRRVILKLFADRQIVVDPKVAAYAAPRIRRTFAAAEVFVDRANQLSYEEKSAITRVIARKAIDDPV